MTGAAWKLRIPERLQEELLTHLFRDDGGEHGAVIAAGLLESKRDRVLLARELPSCRRRRRLRRGSSRPPSSHGAVRQREDPPLPGRGPRLPCDPQPLWLRFGLILRYRPRIARTWIPRAPRHLRGSGRRPRLHQGRCGRRHLDSRSSAQADLRDPDRRRKPAAPLPWPPPVPPAADETFAEAGRIFGDRGQDLFARTKVGVIGGGGVGQLVVATSPGSVWERSSSSSPSAST